MFDSAGTLAVTTAVLVALVASGVGIAFFVGRRGALAALDEQWDEENGLPDQMLRELEKCLELAEYVTRDADSLSALVAAQSPQVERQVGTAVQQLVKTTKSLAGRLNRMGVEASIAQPGAGIRPTALRAVVAGADLPSASLAPAYLAQEEVDGAPQTDKNIKLPESAFEDARRFRRSSFRGSAKATIYPRQSGPGREPVQCTVLTRDLSCGGIGLAHSEQLFPKQIVVLDAVGKLLVGEVRWCRRVDEHFYVAGCRLVKTNN
jgi:hypothetical protein